MIHSLPVEPVREPCETLVRRPHPRLRGHVVSYSGFRTGSPISHRMLPCTIPVLIIDVTGAGRVVTGASSVPAVSAETRWGHGVSVGLTPAGVGALLDIPMRELTGSLVPVGPLVDELTERLAAESSWPGRFAVLEEWLLTHLDPDIGTDPLLTAAWWRLQRPAAVRAAAGCRLGAVPHVATGTATPPLATGAAAVPVVAGVAAELGVSRRRLEAVFQRHIGLPPGTIARVARFQRAVGMVAAGAALPRVAVDSGYADQPHLTREVRALAGLTPTALRQAIAGALPRAFVQDRAR